MSNRDKQMDDELLDRVFTAAVNTVGVAGPLPEDGLQMPAYMRRWLDLIREADPAFQNISDADMRNLFDAAMAIGEDHEAA
jgi:hypothetical protein